MTNMFDYNLYERKETSDGYDYYVPYDIEKTTICGKSIKEIMTILGALELERIYEIKMCMENLSKYKELIDKRDIIDSLTDSYWLGVVETSEYVLDYLKELKEGK